MAITRDKTDAGGVAGPDPAVTEAPAGGKDKVATRRQLLRLAGAAALGAAGAAALKAVPASAADGDPVLTGGLTFETLGFATEIIQTTPGFTVWLGSGETSSTGFYGAVGDGGTGVRGTVFQTFASGGVGVRGQSGASGIGVSGTAIGAGGYGVYGGGTATGVSGYGSTGVAAFSAASYGTGLFGHQFATNGTGVVGIGHTGVFGYNTTTSGSGLFSLTFATGSAGLRSYGLGTGGVGVFAFGSAAGGLGLLAYGALGILGVGVGAGAAGVLAESASGPDLAMAGTGRLLQVANITGGSGAPAFTPTAGDFEVVRATDGAVWASKQTGGGLPTGQAAWKRVNAVRVDDSHGTGVAFKPQRLIDTRKATMPNGQATGGAISSKGARTYMVAGMTGSVSTQDIPATAIAVVGNVTVVSGTSGGFLAIHPSGAAYDPTQDPATFNFGPHQIVSNGYFSGLGTGANAGKIDVYIGNIISATNFIIDITGYIE